MTEAAGRRNRPYAPRLLPEQRREQLLDIVLEIIDTDGVGAVSMDAVARRAGVARPVVYSQFADSNHLLRASLDREEQQPLAQVADPMPSTGDQDAAASFHRSFFMIADRDVVCTVSVRPCSMMRSSWRQHGHDHFPPIGNQFPKCHWSGLSFGQSLGLVSSIPTTVAPWT